MKRLERKRSVPDFTAAVEEFLNHCQTKGLSNRSIEWYKQKLEGFGRFLGDTPLDEVTPNLMRQFIKQGQEKGWQVETVNGYLRTLRAFFNFLVREKILTESPMAGVPLVRGRQSIIQAFTQQQVITLLRIPDKSKFAGYRDYCMMLVLLDTGIRLSEIIGLKVKDLDTETGGLKVFGKGNKERIVYVSPRVLRELITYLKECLEEATPEWPLFPNQWGKRLNSRSFQDNLKEYGKLAGIEGMRVSPHTFRHTFRQALPA